MNMKISSRIVMAWLEPFQPSLMQGAEDAGGFTKCLFLGEAAVEDSVLYIATFDRLHSYSSRLTEESTVICPEDCTELIRGSGIPGRCIVLRGGTDLGEVSNLLNERFRSMAEWEADLDKVIAGNMGLQALLDVSERHFRNPILIITLSFLIPAITRNIPCDDPELIYACEHGTFRGEMIEGLISGNQLMEDKIIDAVAYLKNSHNDKPVLTRSFRENSLQIRGCILCNINTPPSPEEYELFIILGNKIGEYLRHVQETDYRVPVTNEVYDHLLLRLIEGTATEEAVRAYKALLNIGDNTDLSIFVVFFRKEVTAQLFYFMRVIAQNLTHERKFIYQNRIVLISIGKTGSRRRQHVEQFLRSLMGGLAVYCGTTDFNDLSELPYAYRMACIAAELGSALEPDKSMYYYGDYAINHFLRCAAKEIPYGMLYYGKLRELEKLDRERDADDMLLLETFLSMERNYTRVAEKLHLHRNSVAYRVERIERLLEADLDDPEVRLQLIISFRMLKMIDLGMMASPVGGRP